LIIVPLSIMARHERASNESPEPAISKPSSRSRKSTEEKARHSRKRKVVDEEESDSEQNGQPSAKPPRPPAKTAKKPRIPSRSDDDDTDSENSRVRLQKNSEGDPYVDLGKKKRVTVRSFKGTTLVDIREYYGTEGDEKPGKKGIALTVEQWKSLLQASTTITGLL